MRIERLYIKGLRNLEEIDLRGLSGFNFFYGDNGSGKTSILESCSLLSTARSFRSRVIKPIINFDLESCSVFGQLVMASGVKRRLSCVKSRDESGQFTIDGRRQSSVEQHARSLPFVLIDPQVLSIVDGGPVFRRAFLDWGLFHVEQSFVAIWRRFNRALQQRNALLKQGVNNKSYYAPWESELIETAESLAASRQTYFDALMTTSFGIDVDLPLDVRSTITLHHGFDVENFRNQLEETFDRDLKVGYTGIGPQRADIRLRASRFGVDKVLSRGQQKMLVCDLKVRQMQLFKERLGYAPLVLLDDVYSELDARNLERVFKALIAIDAQVFVTSIDRPDNLVTLTKINHKELRMFHVERGKIFAEI